MNSLNIHDEIKRMVARATALAIVLLLGVGVSIASVLNPVIARALSGSQLVDRAIYMSTSQKGASAKYLVTFKVATTQNNVQGIIVDFCQVSPIIGDTNCGSPDEGMATPTFDVGGTTPTVTYSNTVANAAVPTGTTGLPGTWTAAGIDQIDTSTRYRTVKLTSSSAVTLTAGTEYSFDLESMVNPTPDVDTTNNGANTFYARMTVYNSNTGDIAAYTPSTPGDTNLLDYGGFALSVANLIQITAKVQETLTFCASGQVSDTEFADPLDGTDTATTFGCKQSTTPSMTLGAGNPQTIDNKAIYANTAYMQISTNATGGAAIRMHSNALCSGLSSDNGNNCAIPGMNNTTASAMTAGTAAFGLFVGSGYTTTGDSNSTGTITPTAAYNDGTHTTEGTLTAQGTQNPGLYFGMENDANTGVNSTYGSEIATTGGPCQTVNSHLVFAATASLTTPAGIYQANESLIATGTF